MRRRYPTKSRSLNSNNAILWGGHESQSLWKLWSCPNHPTKNNHHKSKTVNSRHSECNTQTAISVDWIWFVCVQILEGDSNSWWFVNCLLMAQCPPIDNGTFRRTFADRIRARRWYNNKIHWTAWWFLENLPYHWDFEKNKIIVAVL